MSTRVVSLKLITGEELITGIDDQESDGAFVLHHPMTVKHTARSTVALEPWMLSSSGDVLLSKSAPISMSLPSKGFMELYADFLGQLLAQDEAATTPNAACETPINQSSFEQVKASKELQEAAKKIAAGELLFVSGGDKVN